MTRRRGGHHHTLLCFDESVPPLIFSIWSSSEFDAPILSTTDRYSAAFTTQHTTRFDTVVHIV